MYGLVNSALQEFVVARHGEGVWQRIRERAGVRAEPFVTMKTYPDSLTYDLVGAACTELGLDGEVFLAELGVFWIQYASDRGYGSLMNLAGNSLFEFLQNLDAMHARVALSYPELKPPSFRCTEVTPDSATLHYYSHRPGLLPFVRGLLSGLADRFSVRIEVTTTPRGADGADHDQLHIRVLSQGSVR
ncbi:MAG: heme NO-binding protein [Deltaproteobacteria bacterium]|nr:heme NO-binding protein [Deltaproteobacteria bacterium]